MQAMRMGRKAIAQDFLVQKQVLQGELHAMTASQQRAAYNAEQRRLLRMAASPPKNPYAVVRHAHQLDTPHP